MRRMKHAWRITITDSEQVMTVTGPATLDDGRPIVDYNVKQIDSLHWIGGRADGQGPTLKANTLMLMLFMIGDAIEEIER